MSGSEMHLNRRRSVVAFQLHGLARRAETNGHSVLCVAVPFGSGDNAAMANQTCNAIDAEKIAEAIRDRFQVASASVDPAWNHAPALKVIDGVLSLNRRYDEFVLPRLKQFQASHPTVNSIKSLRELIDSFDSPADFVAQALNYRDASRAETLNKVVDRLLEIVRNDVNSQSEEEALRAWACAAAPKEYLNFSVPGIGITGFQYLRMLFGADTAKPDVHIKRFVAEIIGRRVSEIEALELLEAAAVLANARVRDLDTTIWEGVARR